MYRIKAKYKNLSIEDKKRYKDKKNKYGIVMIPINEIPLEGLVKKYIREKSIHVQILEKLNKNLDMKELLEESIRTLQKNIEAKKSLLEKLNKELDTNTRLHNVETTLEAIEIEIIKKKGNLLSIQKEALEKQFA